MPILLVKLSNISPESDVLVISIIDRILLISLPDEDGRSLVINEILKRLNINSISFDDIISNDTITNYSLRIVSNVIDKELTNEVDEIGKSLKDSHNHIVELSIYNDHYILNYEYITMMFVYK